MASLSDGVANRTVETEGGRDCVHNVDGPEGTCPNFFNDSAQDLVSFLLK